MAALLAALAVACAAQQIVVPKEPPPLTLEDHLETGHAWTLVQAGFPEILRAHLKQVAGARMGRYYPGAKIGVITPDAQGRFIVASCGKPPKACPEVAEEVERRVLAATLLRALPTYKRPERLYDLDTFRLKEDGLWAFDLTENRYPDLWERLYAMAGARRRRSADAGFVRPAGPDDE